MAPCVIRIAGVIITPLFQQFVYCVRRYCSIGLWVLSSLGVVGHNQGIGRLLSTLLEVQCTARDDALIGAIDRRGWSMLHLFALAWEPCWVLVDLLEQLKECRC